MLKILQPRLQQYLNREHPDVQAGFRKGRGTRDQVANICWIIEKAREFQKSIYFCFIYYAKAFDSVDHNKLWKILKEMGIPGPSSTFQLVRYSSVSFNWAPSTTIPLGESALVSLNKPPAPYLSTRRVFLWSSPTQYLSNGLGCLGIFQLGTSQYLSTGRGQVPAILTNKIQDHNQHGRFENQERLIKFVWTVYEDDQTKGTSTRTKTPVPCRVQMKERNLRWAPSWSP